MNCPTHRIGTGFAGIQHCLRCCLELLKVAAEILIPCDVEKPCDAQDLIRIVATCFGRFESSAVALQNTPNECNLWL